MPRVGPGLYVYLEGDKVLYVGKSARTFEDRFAEYRTINARKCMRDGQAQSCRLNNLVLSAYREGRSIDVYYAVTRQFEVLEGDMIRELRPPWNIVGVV